MDYKFIFQAPNWYLFFALSVAVLYAYILYKKPNSWNKSLNWILAVFRGMVVFVILFLLTEPLIKQSKQTEKKPVIAFIIDNSQSISLFSKTYLQTLKDLINNKKDLSSDKQYKFYSLEANCSEDSLSNIKFDENHTNTQNVISKIEAEHEGEKISGLIVLSDGNINNGLNPLYNSYKYPVYTVGIGDTTQRNDIAISQVNYNKVAFKGNKFLINVQIRNVGFGGSKTELVISENKNNIQKKTIDFKKNKGEQLVSFTLDAVQEGNYHYVIQCTPLKGEITNTNNTAHVYIQVVKNKERILILAQAPHPDVKAINAALNTAQNYEVDVHFIGDNENPKLDQVNAAVLVGIPNKKLIGEQVYQQIIKNQIPCMYVVHSNADLQKIYAHSKAVQIQLRNNESDKAQAALNQNFGVFSITDFDTEIIGKFPPLNVPFGSYSVTTNAEILLNQKIGNSISQNPLWVLQKSNEINSAVVCGEGLWLWRMFEKSTYNQTKNVDELILKSIQVITSKKDKKKFKVIPTEEHFDENDQIAVTTEMYDQLNEPIYDKEVTLEIVDENKKVFTYKYVHQQLNDKFEIGKLEHGTYTYQARTQIGEKTEKYSGAFTVHPVQLEQQLSQANHLLLQNLSTQTNGLYFNHNQIKDLIKSLNQLKDKGTITYHEEYDEIVNIKWILVLLILFICIEWFLRKYFGNI
ncbi:MAG: hypothetical protein U0V72_07775 [Cytophagales bacterium]